jgi:flagellar biosynthesis protein FlhB
VSDKTEEASPRRLRKAREEGDSGVSAFAAQAVAFAVAVVLVPASVRSLAVFASGELRDAIHHVGRNETVIRTAEGIGRHANVIRPIGGLLLDPVRLAVSVISLVGPCLAGVALASALAAIVQTGGIVASRRLAPKLDRLNPFSGLRALFSPNRLFVIARSLFAAAVVCWLVFDELKVHAADIAHLSGRLRWAGPLVAELSGTLAWRAAFVGLGLAIVDVVVTRGAWRRRLRMTKAELKQEHKEAEGDPQIRAARERAHREMLAQASIAAVRDATVVVVNPTHVACALRYEENRDEAPVVVATGQGDLAHRIVSAALDYSVPTVQDAPLARSLVELEVGSTIPEVLYEAVAEILREVAGGA